MKARVDTDVKPCGRCRAGGVGAGRGHVVPAGGCAECRRRSLEEAGGEAGHDDTDSPVPGQSDALPAPAAALQGNAPDALRSVQYCHGDRVSDVSGVCPSVCSWAAVRSKVWSMLFSLSV